MARSCCKYSSILFWIETQGSILHLLRALIQTISEFKEGRILPSNVNLKIRDPKVSRCYETGVVDRQAGPNLTGGKHLSNSGAYPY